MNSYQFEKFPSRMAKKYGKIPKGKEDYYAMTLFSMEGNLLKVHRQHPSSNSWRVLEAISLALIEVEGHINGETSDIAKFENEDNLRLKYALLMAFDPYTNPEIREGFTEMTKADLSNPASMEKYYKSPIMCILRILDSVNLWMNQQGSNGYFDFLESFIGKRIKNDGKMNYSISVDPEVGMKLMDIKDKTE